MHYVKVGTGEFAGSDEDRKYVDRINYCVARQAAMSYTYILLLLSVTNDLSQNAKGTLQLK